MLKLVLIADDLTGANDSGVQFAKQGLNVHVFLENPSTGFGADLPDVVVLDTDSRALPSEQAAERIRATGKIIRTVGSARPMIFKKIDSTLRGNIGAEVDAAMAEYGLKWAAVAPAFPRNARITVGGWHLLNQVPLAESEIARDPKTPVHESSVPQLLASQSCHDVGHVDLSYVSRGLDAIQQRIGELRRQEIRIISFDATAPEPPLWVGCAGLAEMVPSVMGWTQQHRIVNTETAGPVLVMAGSVSPVTARQMSQFLAGENARLVSLRAEALLTDETAELARCVGEAREGLSLGRDILVASAVEAGAVAIAQAQGTSRGLDGRQVSEMVAAAMGKIVQELTALPLAGMFLTGGDTAVAVCRALGVGSIEILAEVLPGIPLGQLVGGWRPGLRVVTKAGAFGADTAIVESVRVLKGKEE